MTDTATAPRWIEYRTVEEIQPALKNPKKHHLESLRASIRRWGFADPIVVDERTGRLLGGHGRTEMIAALEALGERPPDWPDGKSWPPEGIVVDPDGRWRLPVTRGIRTENDDEAHALGVALNRGPEAGGWDNRELADLLSSFRDRDAELLAASGFAADELGLLLASVKDPAAVVPPTEFPVVDSDLPTQYRCPRCSYEWSGASAPGAGPASGE